jgi:anti-sigma regulatory factor (Ser/Thr protein kinase)
MAAIFGLLSSGGLQRGAFPVNTSVFLRFPRRGYASREGPLVVHQQYPQKEDEGSRLEALRQYRILDTEPERAFDDLTLLASQICQTPIALISLVDADRQWFKSRIGVSATETARSSAFCAHAIMQEELFVVADTLKDERFRENPLVFADPHIRFYAGAPLTTTEGYALGTLCVIDRVPRNLTAGQREALGALQRQAMAQLELRRNLQELEQMLQERERASADREGLIEELRTALEHVKKLSAVVPLCTTCQFNMLIPADVDAISKVSDGVMQFLRGGGCAREQEFEIKLALEEALANAIRHGCKFDKNKKIQCCVTTDQSGEVLIVVRDPGPGFDPAAVPDPRLEDQRMRSGGRGIFLINELMDEVRYEDAGREIQMRKRCNPPAEPGRS